MLVPVRSDDVLLVRRKDERGQEGGVSQEGCSSGRVFMSRKGVCVHDGHGCGCGQRCEGATPGDVSMEMVVIGRKRGAPELLKTSPNLSATTSYDSNT
jgi:hypothetical protein